MYVRSSASYMNSPDMAAFTIGRVSIDLLNSGQSLSETALLARLIRVTERGMADPSTGVSAQMAQGALQYLQMQRAGDCNRILPRR